MTPIALVIGTIFVSTFIRSAIGFGNALLAMPILAMVIGIQTATPLLALIGATIAASILCQSWREVDLGAAGRLIAVSLLGIPCGLLLLAHAPQQLVMALLGIVLITYALYNLLTPGLPHIRHEGLTYLCGFLAGVLGSAYNTNGPPIVIYGTLRRWSPDYFRATLQYYFLITGLAILAGHALSGMWTPAVLQLYLVSLPPMAIGIALGGRVNRLLPSDLFRRIIYVTLLGIGVLCLL